jgi:hypothetical protein
VALRKEAGQRKAALQIEAGQRKAALHKEAGQRKWRYVKLARKKVALRAPKQKKFPILSVRKTKHRRKH